MVSAFSLDRNLHVSESMTIHSKYPNSSFLSTLTGHLIDLPQRVADLFCALDGLEDSNFSTALDADPLARIWEMMVATILKESGLTVFSSGGIGPDFTTVNHSKKIVVEAICATPGEDGRPDSVPPLVPRPDFQKVPVDQLLLRIRSAIHDKKQVLDRYRETGVISSEDLCVIAISSSKLSQARSCVPCLGVTATLGYGGPYAVFDSRTAEKIEEGLLLKENVRKVNNSLVDTLAFLDDSNSMIAGILYSDASMYSLNFALTEATYFIHNPKAQQCVLPGTFKVGHELWTILSTEGDCWKTYDITRSAS
jgi:hypothetical protein